MVKFGITERGDISFTDEYISKIHHVLVEAAIVISKGLPTENGKKFLIDNSNKIIFHATTTGLGGSLYEPSVLQYSKRLGKLKQFIESGFPITHVVIRVDPIMNTASGFETAKKVIKDAYELGFRRFRYSFMDMYRHVQDRFKALDIIVPPNVNKLPKSMVDDLTDNFMGYYENLGCTFESCGEYTRHKVGCISAKDYELCNIDLNRLEEASFKQRSVCSCCAGKTELLSNRKRCPYKCLYCYWKDE